MHTCYLHECILFAQLWLFLSQTTEDATVQLIDRQASTVFPLVEVGSHILAGSLIQGGGLTTFVPIQAGSQIEAGV